MKKFTYFVALVISFTFIVPAYAQNYNNDLAITPDSVVAVSDVIAGKTVRIYATVINNSKQDLFGVVKFYDENRQSFVGEDQPVSVIAEKTDDVFVDWRGDTVGNHEISVRVIPWNEDGDDPSNNKVTKTIYVDVDSDSDGLGDRVDADDDNDGVKDVEDDFPNNPDESKDTDGDGIGNNADEDDDNDGISDIADLFPLDVNETDDKDGDGVGDNTDAFPEDPNESVDSDNDGLGDNSDPDNKNHGPVPSIETDKQVVSEKSIVTFNALQSDDPDGEIVSYEWDFGDGTSSTGVVVDHVFEKTGNYNVTLNVVDDKGEGRGQTIEISVIYKWQRIVLAIALIFFILLILSRKTLRGDDRKRSLEKEIIATHKVAIKSKPTKRKAAKTTKKKTTTGTAKKKPDSKTKKALPKRKK